MYNPQMMSITTLEGIKGLEIRLKRWQWDAAVDEKFEQT